MISTNACNKLENYELAPKIMDGSYTLLKSISGQDTALLLRFTFTDGDGNVGLRDADTFPPNDRNLFVDYYERQSGGFTKILIPNTDDTLNFNSRIRDFGSGTAAKGMVEMHINISFVIADTIRFDYSIQDKSGNRSNWLSTGKIPLNN